MDKDVMRFQLAHSLASDGVDSCKGGEEVRTKQKRGVVVGLWNGGGRWIDR
jgi:hypothetical protein